MKYITLHPSFLDVTPRQLLLPPLFNYASSLSLSCLAFLLILRALSSPFISSPSRFYAPVHASPGAACVNSLFIFQRYVAVRQRLMRRTILRSRLCISDDIINWRRDRSARRGVLNSVFYIKLSRTKDVGYKSQMNRGTDEFSNNSNLRNSQSPDLNSLQPEYKLHNEIESRIEDGLNSCLST